MTNWIFLFIIIVHWISDFVMQSDYMANQKSSSNSALLSHTLMYTSVFTFLLFISPISTTLLSLLLFWIITFTCHTVTDYYSSRAVKRKFDLKLYGSPIPNFEAFSIIGFDQVLHYIQLIVTFNLVIL